MRYRRGLGRCCCVLHGRWLQGRQSPASRGAGGRAGDWLAGHRSRAARSGSAARGAHARGRGASDEGRRQRLPYVRGSVIVKYKGDPDDVRHRRRFPPDANPEAMAAAMRARPDVEFAQPRYRNYAMAQPNDPLYVNQWNFPAIDMERAWDIQPGATSEIIVAVLDSGMAFRDITVRYSIPVAVPHDPKRSALSRARLGRRAIRRGAGTRRERIAAVRLAARLHLGRRPAGRSRRSRHARRRHDWPADEQR